MSIIIISHISSKRFILIYTNILQFFLDILRTTNLKVIFHMSVRTPYVVIIMFKWIVCSTYLMQKIDDPSGNLQMLWGIINRRQQPSPPPLAHTVGWAQIISDYFDTKVRKIKDQTNGCQWIENR